METPPHPSDPTFAVLLVCAEQERWRYQADGCGLNLATSSSEDRCEMCLEEDGYQKGSNRTEL